jgi:hypothetical protein
MTGLHSYREHRDSLLIKIIETLSKDGRFIAGWLTGSYSKNEADSLSDIDLSLVVSDKYSASLCTRLEQVSARTSPERYALFSQFGKPALLHENNNNAPEGGTFTFVLYSESAVMVDWILTPQSKAIRPYQSRLLFEKIVIPVSDPPKPDDPEQSRQSVAENWAFFWMMMAITIKYLIRNDGVFVTQWIENLHALVHEIERKMNREPWKYHRGSRSQLRSTSAKQIESLQQLCQRMQNLQPKVAEFINSEAPMPLTEIETLLSFVINTQSKIANQKS